MIWKCYDILRHLIYKAASGLTAEVARANYTLPTPVSTGVVCFMISKEQIKSITSELIMHYYPISIHSNNNSEGVRAGYTNS
jgi:hypothetical protein